MIPVRSQWGRYNLPRSIELFGIWRFTKVCGSPPHCPTEVLLSLTGPTNAPLHTPVACKHHAATSQIFAEYDPMRISWGYRQAKWYCNSGWWFQPLWKILVGWDYSSHIICIYIYVEKIQMFQKPPTSISGTHYYHQLSIGHHMPLISNVFQRICWVSIVFLPWLYQWTIMVCLRIGSPQSWWFFLGWEGHFLTLVNI